MSLWNYKLFMFYVLTSMDVPYKTKYHFPNLFLVPISMYFQSRECYYSVCYQKSRCVVFYLGTESNADFKKLFLSILKLFWQTKKVTFFICYSCNVYTMGWMIMYKWIVAKSELWPKISFTIHFYSTIK